MGAKNLFEIAGVSKPYKVTKPIRLIELFAGIGAQASALERLGANFEHYRVCEFDKYAIASYNAVHGTNFETSDIREIHASDLGIVEKDKYEYILFYSFPCTDLSVAGKQAGMSRESGTRSGLLWEVERLLKESKEIDALPQILCMENVPAIHSDKFLPDLMEWVHFLESLGYSNFWQDMNAKDYGVAQSRNRTFMVSIFGNYTYTFPNPIPLKKRMRDYLETNVDDKYYIRSEKAMQLIQKLVNSADITEPQSGCDKTINNPSIIDIANCITARYDSGISNLGSDGTAVVETGIVQNLATPDLSVEAEFKQSDIAGCIAAREYKGVANWGSNAVVEEKKTD